MLGVAVGAVDSVHPDGTYVTIDMHLDPGRQARRGHEGRHRVAEPGQRPLRPAHRRVPVRPDRSSPGRRSRSRDTATPVELDTLYRNLIQLTGALGPERRQPERRAVGPHQHRRREPEGQRQELQHDRRQSRQGRGVDAQLDQGRPVPDHQPPQRLHRDAGHEQQRPDQGQRGARVGHAGALRRPAVLRRGDPGTRRRPWGRCRSSSRTTAPRSRSNVSKLSSVAQTLATAARRADQVAAGGAAARAEPDQRLRPGAQRC